MKLGGALFFIALTGLQLALAQDVTDCTVIATGLETTAIEPDTVPDLPVCEDERDMAQCCSTDYILSRLNITEVNYLDGLREELRERFQAFNELAERLRQYAEGDFVNGYASSIGDFSFLRGRNDFFNSFTSDLRANIEFDPSDEGANGRFNIQRFLRNMVSRLEDMAVDDFSQQSAELEQCIREVFEAHVENQKMEAQAEALQQIRRVLAAIENLQSFLRNFTEDLAGYRPLQQCINRIVELDTCGRCVATRPLFCQNVCRAVARACYSPFNDALGDQLEILWEVIRRIIDVATDAIGDLNSNRGILRADNRELIQQLNMDCNVSISQRPGKRQAGGNGLGIPLLPEVIRTAARALRGGPFDYAGRRQRGPGMCQRLDTARENCWDGERDRDTDIDEFDEDGIDGQVDNPVIDLNEDELREQADSLGTPISAAFSDPSFAQVAPQGLVIPEAGNNNGAASVVFSFTLLTLVLVAGVFMM